MATKKVFVYGTLRKGQPLHEALRHSEFLWNWSLRGYKMYDLGSYPCIIHTGDYNDVVVGELYEIDKPTSERLDIVEGCDRILNGKDVNLYDVKEISDIDGIVYEVYVMTKTKASAFGIDFENDCIESGNWLKRFDNS